MSSLSQDTMLSHAAKYFKMKQQILIANNLIGHVLTTSRPLSILLGKHYYYLLVYIALTSYISACDDLYKQAVDLNAIQQLETRLGMSC